MHSLARFLFKGLLLGAFCFFQLHLDAFNSALFYQKLREPTPQWMIEQIEQDLAPFTKELSRQFLDELFAAKGEIFHAVRIRVAQGRLTVQASNSSRDTTWVHDIIIPRIRELHQLMPLPDIDFIFSGRDFITNNDQCEPCLPSDTPLYPVLIMSKCTNDKGLIIFPDWFALNEGYEPAKSLILEGNAIYPWEAKQKILFFRGADSGVWDRANWRNRPRPKMVSLSLQYPHLIDAKFYSLLEYEKSPYIRDIMKKEGLMGNFVSMKDHPRYMYLMDIDGHCAAAPRFPLLLHSNSVIFKHTTTSILWFYPKIKPYVHFIPVAEDLSDLLTQLEWANKHEEECKKISQNARELAAEVLTHESIYQYLYELLKAYSMKQMGQYWSQGKAIK